MCTRYMTTLVIVASLLACGHAFAHSGGVTHTVDCSAVINGMDHDASAILVRGHQNVTIKGLTVQNGLIGVHVGLGASAWIEDVTAKDSRYKAGHNSGFGILIANSSEAVLTGAVVATDNATDGIIVWQGGRASVIGNMVFEGDRLPQASLQANDNGGNGIQVGVGSSLQVQAPEGTYSTVQANGNGSNGILLGKGSSAQFGGGASIEATGNSAAGLVVVNGSSAGFEAWGDAQGFTGTFSDNGEYGIIISNNATLNASAGGTASTITVTNNVTDEGWGYGLLVDVGSSVFFEPPSSDNGSKLVLNNNGCGAGVYSNSVLNLRMPAEIQNNAQNGIDAWSNALVDSFGGTHTLIAGNDRSGISAWNGVSIYLESDTVADNKDIDVSAGQGSRLNWDSDSRVDSVYCDASALAFNDAVCPGEAAEEPSEGSGQ